MRVPGGVALLLMLLVAGGTPRAGKSTRPVQRRRRNYHGITRACHNRQQAMIVSVPQERTLVFRKFREPIAQAKTSRDV